jgi:hypothetical protein
MPNGISHLRPLFGRRFKTLTPDRDQLKRPLVKVVILVGRDPRILLELFEYTLNNYESSSSLLSRLKSAKSVKETAIPGLIL